MKEEHLNTQKIAMDSHVLWFSKIFKCKEAPAPSLANYQRYVVRQSNYYFFSPWELVQSLTARGPFDSLIFY